MSVIRWDPSGELVDLRRTVRRLFDDLRRESGGPRAFPVDVYENAEEIVLQAELPGVRPEDVQVQIDGARLSIRARRQAGAPDGARALQRETAAGEFVRSFGLGIPVAADRVGARYENGVLTVHLPKAEEARSRTIAVQAA